MGVPKQPRRGVTEHLVRQMFISIGALANREIAAPALVAFAANYRKGHHDALALLQITIYARADLYHLAHHLVAHDIPRHHGGNEVVEQVEVGSADSTTRDFDYCIARVFDFGIGHGIATDI